jgi:hypothetical protein
MLIQELLGKEYLDRFKVYYAQSLFEPDWKQLEAWRCPICTNRLKLPQGKGIALCNSKKHKTFIISRAKLVKLSFI